MAALNTGKEQAGGAPPALLTRAHFMRWLAPLLLVFAVFGYDAIGVALVLVKPLEPKSFLAVPTLPIALISVVPGLVYASAFFINLLFVQRCDGLPGHRPWLRAAAGVLVVMMGALLCIVLAVVLLVAFFAIAWASKYPPVVPEPVALTVGGTASGALFGAALGLAHQLVGAETGGARGLRAAHSLGGAIAGFVLGLGFAGITALPSPVQSPNLLGIGLLLLPVIAVVPHATLAWRSIARTLTSNALPTTTQCLLRSLAVLAVLAALGAAGFVMSR